MSLPVLIIFSLVTSSLGSKTVQAFSKAQQSEENSSVANFRESSACAAGWTEFDHTGKCYKVTPSRLSWDEALSACKSAVANPSASLASIPDQMTSDFLITISPSISAWVGGYKTSDDEWAWTDGTQMTFTNWESGQPNNCC